MTPSLIDTNLVVDWCLWKIADDPTDRSPPSWGYQVLRLKPDLRSFETFLKRSPVLLAEHTLAEVGGVLRRRLTNPHRGDKDRKNELVVKAVLSFLESFRPRLQRVSEETARTVFRRLNKEESGARIDFGDAALVAALPDEAQLITADKQLFDRCIQTGRLNVLHFDGGAFFDVRGQPVDER